MYLEHFGLNVFPFSLSPKLDFLYNSENFSESMAHLVYGVSNNEAIVLVTGPIGTGKTMALQSFLSNLGSRFEFCLITNTRVSSLELLKLMFEDLGVSFPPGSDKSDLLILFKRFLLESHRKGKTVLLVIDEAQNLSPGVLEELRLLTNLGQGDVQPVQIILVGQPELEGLMSRPDMAQIRQRIRVHYVLSPMNREETEGYLAHRMAVAGCERRAFSKGAIDRIFQLSGGVPRVVNSLAGNALLSAFVAGRDSVKPEDVTEDESCSVEVEASRPPATASNQTAPEPGRMEPETPATAPTPLAASEQPAAPPVMAHRAKNRGSRKSIWLWIAATLLLGAMGVLYFTGALEDFIPASFPGLQASTARDEVSAHGDEAKPAGTPEGAALLDVEPGDLPADDEAAAMAAADREAMVIDDAGADLTEDLTVAAETQPGTSPAESDPEVRTALAAEETSHASTQGFFVHVYSFRSQERAKAYADAWRHPGVHSVVRAKTVSGETWSRVYLGPFISRSEAGDVARHLKDLGAITYYQVTALSLGDST
jgi:type II secretory pathway predicted ATPase ExeA